MSEQWAPGAAQTNFEGFAIVELMGHQREIGFVTTQAFGQAVMFRIDQPELPEREYTLTQPEYVSGHGTLPIGSKVKRAALPARSRLVSPGALYAINPCTEQAALEAIDRTASRPLILIERPAQSAIAPAESDSLECDCGAAPWEGHEEDCIEVEIPPPPPPPPVPTPTPALAPHAMIGTPRCPLCNTETVNNICDCTPF